jgi:hypothetical protein
MSKIDYSTWSVDMLALSKRFGELSLPEQPLQELPGCIGYDLGIEVVAKGWDGGLLIKLLYACLDEFTSRPSAYDVYRVCKELLTSIVEEEIARRQYDKEKVPQPVDMCDDEDEGERYERLEGPVYRSGLMRRGN